MCPAITQDGARRRAAQRPGKLLLGAPPPPSKPGCAAEAGPGERQPQTGLCGCEEDQAGQTRGPRCGWSTCAWKLRWPRRPDQPGAEGPARSAQASGEAGGGARAPAGLQQFPELPQLRGGWCSVPLAIVSLTVHRHRDRAGVVAHRPLVRPPPAAKRALAVPLRLHCLQPFGAGPAVDRATGNGAQKATPAALSIAIHPGTGWTPTPAAQFALAKRCAGGTQMLTKGNRPCRRVDPERRCLAAMPVHRPDLRRRTMPAGLLQTGGRGRAVANAPAKVIVQTYSPDHPVIRI